MSLSSLLDAMGFGDYLEIFLDKQITYDKVRNLTRKDIESILTPVEAEHFWNVHCEYFLEKEERADVGLRNDTGRQPLADISNQVQRINEIFVTENVNVHEILDSTFEGKAILNYYSHKHTLNGHKRNKITHLIMCAVLRQCTRELTDCDFMILRRKIIEEFSTEIGCIYYSPSVPKNKSLSGKSIRAAGKLISKYGNLKRIPTGVYKPSRASSYEIEDEEDDVLAEDVQASIEWLQTLEEPWDTTKKHWENTYDCRHKDNDPKKRISSTYEEWPILKCPRAYELFEIDFNLSKLCEVEKPIDNFNAFYLEVSKIKTVPKEELCKSLQEHLEQIELNEDSRIYIELMLMSFMFASNARIRQGARKYWKPSCLESFEGIVVHVKSYGDIQKAKENRQLFAGSKNVTLQPYIIVVGAEDFQVDSSYLIVDDYEYEIPSLAEAIDYCFKAFYALSAEYPLQSSHLWLLLQHGLYKFRTRWDPLELGVEEILNDIHVSLPPLTKESLKVGKSKSAN